MNRQALPTSKAWLFLLLNLVLVGSIRAQGQPEGASDAPPETTARQGGASSFLNHLALQMRLSNTYDSNIDHDEENLESYGLIPALRLRYHHSLSDPLFTVDYTIARHAYTNTEEWDRVSNTVRAAFMPEITRRLHAETIGEVSLRGSSEDRDLSNQYFLTQELEYRLTRNNRFQIYGTLRWKRFPENPASNAFKPHIGARFDRRIDGGRRWEIGARYERKQTESTRLDYTRWTFDTEYRLPVFGLRDLIKFEVKYRSKLYEDRFVEIENEDFLRRDHQWVLGVTWQYTVLQGFYVELDYQFETRDSNDPEKAFNAHLIALALVYDW